MTEPAVREISLKPQSDPRLRRYTRVLAMVSELHKAGYQRVRLFPSLSPNGSFWRAEITFAENTNEDGSPINSDLVAQYSSGDGSAFFGWTDASDMNARQLAATFIERFPEIVRRGEGRDWRYAGWLLDVLGAAEQGNPVVLWVDHDLLSEEHQKMWAIPKPSPQSNCLNRGFASKWDPISVQAADFLSSSIQELNDVLAWEFDVERIDLIDLSAYKKIFEVVEYKRFLMACYACGFVTTDTSPDFPLEAANHRPSEVLANCDLNCLRHYLHTLCRAERWSDGYDSPVLEALISGALQLVGNRLGTDETLRIQY